jgi:hypothetical protein
MIRRLRSFACSARRGFHFFALMPASGRARGRTARPLAHSASRARPGRKVDIRRG